MLVIPAQLLLIARRAQEETAIRRNEEKVGVGELMIDSRAESGDDDEVRGD